MEEMLKQGITSFVIKCPSQSFQGKLQHQNHLIILSFVGQPFQACPSYWSENRRRAPWGKWSFHACPCTSSISLNVNHRSQMFIKRTTNLFQKEGLRTQKHLLRLIPSVPKKKQSSRTGSKKILGPSDCSLWVKRLQPGWSLLTLPQSSSNPVKPTYLCLQAPFPTSSSNSQAPAQSLNQVYGIYF